MKDFAIIKNVEDSFKPLLGKKFYSLADLKKEVSCLWNKLLIDQSSTFVTLSKGISIVNLGIVADVVPDENAFFLLKFLKIAPRKIVYSFDFDNLREPLSCLLQNVERLDDDLKSKEDLIRSLKVELESPQKDQNVQNAETVPISRLYRLASTYQRILMHADDLQDEVVASAIRKDAKAALRGQGMIIVEYDGTNDEFFNVVEDDNCEDYIMTCPAITSKDSKIIIAKGNLFKHI